MIKPQMAEFHSADPVSWIVALYQQNWSTGLSQLSVLLTWPDVSGFVCDQDALKHPWCDLVYLTDIMADFDCDVFFPEFDRELFEEQER